MLFPSLEERTSAAVDLPRLSFSVIPCPLSDHPHLSPQHPHSPSTSAEALKTSEWPAQGQNVSMNLKSWKQYY